MAKLTNENLYRRLSKEKMIELAKLYGRLGVILDGYWFLGVEKEFGTGKAIEIDEATWAQYGRTKARYLKKFLSVEKPTSLKDIAAFCLLAPIFGNLGAEVEIKKDKCVFSVTDCHPQKARIRKGLGEFPCKSVNLAYLNAFFGELNPDIRFHCVTCPPDPHTNDLWCRWEAWCSP